MSARLAELMALVWLLCGVAVLLLDGSGGNVVLCGLGAVTFAVVAVAAELRELRTVASATAYLWHRSERFR